MIDSVLEILFGREYAKRVQPHLRQSYEHAVRSTWLSISQIFNYISDAPDTRVIYTATIRPQTHCIGDRRYLIYDQYLGQILNQLTRLTAHKAPVSAVDAYLIKLAAQRYFVAGNTREAIRRGLHAAILQQSVDESGFTMREADPKLLLTRSTLTYCQERFVIAHELMHSYLGMNRDLKSQLAADYCHVIVPSYKATMKSVHESDDMADRAFWEDAWRQYERRQGEELSAEEREDLISKALSDDSDESSERWRIENLTSDLTVESSLVEECVCDLVGALAVAKSLAGERIPLSTVMVAASLALHHLRLIQSIDRLVEGAWGRDITGTSGDAFASAMLRLSLFRFSAEFAAEYLLGGERPKLQRFLHQKMVKANLEHAEIILDPYVFELERILAEGTTNSTLEKLTNEFDTNPAALVELLRL